MASATVDPPWPSRTLSLVSPTSTGGDGGHHGGGGGGGGGGGHGGDKLQEWSSLIGIITAIVGNVLIALALNVQRYAHTRLHKEQSRMRRKASAAMRRANGSQASQAEGTTIRGAATSTATYGTIADGSDEEDGHADHREDDPLASSFQSSDVDVDVDMDSNSQPSMTYLKSPYWWLGQILITLGEMGNFLAYGFAPASIVSPLGVVALISNCIIAPAMFHERFRPRDFWGVVIAVSGVVTVVWSANQEETKLGPDDVWGAITTMEFEIYMGVTVGLIIALMWASTRYGKRTILIDLGLVGLFGGYTALSTKGVSSMLSSTLWGAFTTPVTYALLFILLATAIMQIRYVNKALQRFDSTQVIPIQFVMFTLCVIVGSAVLYRDFEKTTAEQAGKFIGGCLLTFFGVFLITSGRESRGDDDEDLLSEADGIEETIGLAQHDGNPSFPPYQDDPNERTHHHKTTVSHRPGRSRHSRLNFASAQPAKPEAYRDEDDTSGGAAAAAGASGLSLGFGEANSGSSGYFSEQPDALVSNPWQDDHPRQAPSASASALSRALRTFSADSVPTRSALGLGMTRSQAHHHPHSHSHSHSHSTAPARESRLHLQGSSHAERPPTPRGHSYRSSIHHLPRTFISPSPLSSTFTTVVKDAFLREGGSGDGLPSNRPVKRTFRSSIRASLFFDDEQQQQDERVDRRTLGALEEPESETEPEPRQLAMPASVDTATRPEVYFGGDGDAGSKSKRKRSRSLSDAIGEFFRPKKDPKENELAHEEDFHRSP